MWNTLKELLKVGATILAGDTSGLAIYYLEYPAKWLHLAATQSALLLLISVLMALAEAVHHEPKRRKGRDQCLRYMQQFFFSLLLTLMLTFKPQ